MNYVDDRFVSTSYSALQCAAVRGSEQMVSLLLKSGADCEYKGTAGVTALELARNKKSASVVRILEEAPPVPVAPPPTPLAPTPSAASPPPSPIY